MFLAYKICVTHFHLFVSFTGAVARLGQSLYGVVFNFMMQRSSKTIKVRAYNFAQVLRYVICCIFRIKINFSNNDEYICFPDIETQRKVD